MITVNIRGVLNGITAGLPIMEAQGSGQFINTVSIGAHVVAPTGVVYCATKYDAIARAVLYAISQPDDIGVNEVLVRPTVSPDSQCVLSRSR